MLSEIERPAASSAAELIRKPELRRALEQVGRSKISRIGRLGSRLDGEETIALRKMIDAIVESAHTLSRSKTGALMVIEREIKLGEAISGGSIINADATVMLISNIFYPNTPMHDGAMIFREGRIHAAGCYLPLSDNYEIGKELGTRHRAARGMSEQSDALIVVVSEETGAITIAIEGELVRNLPEGRLAETLEEHLIGQKTDDKPKSAFWRKSQ